MARKNLPTKTSERSHKELTKAQIHKFYDDQIPWLSEKLKKANEIYWESSRNYIKSLPTEKQKEEAILEKGKNYLRELLGPWPNKNFEKKAQAERIDRAI